MEIHVPQLRALAVEKSIRFVEKPRLHVGSKVSSAKEDIWIKKRYKQNYKNEVFAITKVPTFNPATYILTDDTEDTRKV